MQGIWPEAADGTDVNAVDRSPDGTLLCTGDDFGNVKLFRYPCTKPGSEYKLGEGHSSHVMGVRFSRDGSRVFSVGGNDRTVLQWRVKY